MPGCECCGTRILAPHYKLWMAVAHHGCKFCGTRTLPPHYKLWMAVAHHGCKFCGTRNPRPKLQTMDGRSSSVPKRCRICFHIRDLSHNPTARSGGYAEYDFILELHGADLGLLSGPGDGQAHHVLSTTYPYIPIALASQMKH